MHHSKLRIGGSIRIRKITPHTVFFLKKAVNPDETLFVVDSMTGQDAVNTAREFNERLDFNGTTAVAFRLAICWIKKSRSLWLIR